MIRMPLIAVDNLIKTYQVGTVTSTVLQGIVLQIDAGECAAIVGPSGSGKSTFMTLLGVLDRPDSGRYLFDGRDVLGLSDDALARLRNESMGFVFQQFNLLPRLTALQNVALPLTYRPLSSTVIEKRAWVALERVGMASFARHRPLQLSGGQQQRVAIARALVGEPRLLLADEPTGALDSGTSQAIMRLFLDLHQEGLTLIVVTHDEKIAAQCARRIQLTDGHITADMRL